MTLSVTTGKAKGTDVAAATGFNVAAGDTVVVVTNWGTGESFVSLSDGVNTYVSTNGELTNIGGEDFTVFECENASAVTGGTLTLTGSGGGTVYLKYAVVHSDAGTTEFDAAPVQNSDASSPFTSPNYVTTVADQILIAGFASDSGSNPATIAESTGFTIQQSELNGAVDWSGCLATRTVSATGTYAASFTSTGGANCCVSLVGVREVLAGGSSGQVVPRLPQLNRRHTGRYL